MGPLKNIRHERFAREFVKTGVASRAYRVAYPTVRSDNARWAAASRLLRHVRVKRRITTLKERLMKRSDITIEKILSDYQVALDMAKRNEKSGDVVMAAKEQARLVGLLIDRRELGNAGDFDSMTDPADVLAKIEKEIGPEAAKAMASAFGLAKAASAELPAEQAVLGPSDTDTIN